MYYESKYENERKVKQTTTTKERKKERKGKYTKKRSASHWVIMLSKQEI